MKRSGEKQVYNAPANLKPRLVTGVTMKLLTTITPIEKLKMSTQYTNINMHTVDSPKVTGRGHIR